MATNAGLRVLVTGMGSQLGSLVASELEHEPWISSIAGLDADPPRRRLDRSEFHLIEPGDKVRTTGIVKELNPHLIIHLGVWEPDARANPKNAELLTQQSAESVFVAARRAPALQHVILRSGLEVYGRGGGRVDVPDETATMRPTSQYGRMLMYLEHAADRAFNGTTTRITSLRLAPVIGPHVPSPLGRLLRLPMVPFNALRSPLFNLLHETDAARAFVLAARHQPGTPINILGDGAVSGFAAVRHGRRLPLPLVGPEWTITRRITHLMGAPAPEHVMELLHRGRRATSGACEQLLGWTPEMSTMEVMQSLFSWEGVVRVPAKQVWEVAS
jgi:UDP-glucose 4-epimerase